MPDTYGPQSHWKAEFDLMMEQINKSLAETKRIMDGVADGRGEPPRPHLTLVSNDDDEKGA